MKRIYYTLLTIAFVAVAFGGAYLLCVGAAWVLTTLLALAFHNTLQVNVWIAGLVGWLVLGSIVGIKNLIK